MTCDDCGAHLGTRDMLFLCALFAMKAFGLALTLFLSVLKSQLVVALSWNSASLVLSIRIWFRKRRRKPPDGDKTNCNIRPHPAHPIIFWALPLLDNECKRGREAANKYSNMQSPREPTAKKGLAKANFKYKI